MTEKLIIRLDPYEGDELGTLHAVTVPFLVGNDKAGVMGWSLACSNVFVSAPLDEKPRSRLLAAVILGMVVVPSAAGLLTGAPVREIGGELLDVGGWLAAIAGCVFGGYLLRRRNRQR